MSQSRASSLLEAATNVAVGWIVALATQLVMFPVVGLQAQPGQHVVLSLTFTGISFLRSYVLRRFFARWA